MNANDADTEKGAALAAALEELFRQYPTPLSDTYERSRIWREAAIRHALNGYTKAAISFAMDTGVPDDVLTTLRMLLDG